jgi:hypothetical protein
MRRESEPRPELEDRHDLQHRRVELEDRHDVLHRRLELITQRVVRGAEDRVARRIREGSDRARFEN